MQSPMQPVAPPTKKIKGVESVDAVRKRRDELDRLKKKQEMRSAKGVPSRAPPPPPRHIDRVRHSDIFPGVDKVAKTTKEHPRGPIPPKSSRMQPPPRRLDESFERRGASPARAGSPHRRSADRSKSAPPSRPPPPSVPPPAVKDDSTPKRGHTPRPKALTPGVTVVKPKPPPIAAGLSSSSPPPPVATPKAPPTPSTKTAPFISTPAPPIATPKGPPSAATPKAPPLPPTPSHHAPPTTPRMSTPAPLPGSAPPTPPTPQLAPPTVPSMKVPTLAVPVPAPLPFLGTVASKKDVGPAPVPTVEPAPAPAPAPSPAPAPAPTPFPVASFEPEKPTLLPLPPSNIAAVSRVTNPAIETKFDTLPPPASQPAPVDDNEDPHTNEVDPRGASDKVADAPPKPRQTLISNMHQYAETPSKISEHDQQERQESSKTETSLLRLEKEVREHEKAKAEALRRVVELEEEVQKLKESKLAAETPKTSTAQVGFFSPLSPGLATPRASSHRRMATPHPKYHMRKTGGGGKDSEESRSLLSDSVNYIPFEYTTEVATFIIRRPYGKASERELWFEAGHSNSKQYQSMADVNKPETLEIVAQIAADGSVLSLHGKSFVRHRSNDDDADWTEFGDADALETPLGNVTYIDSDTSEKEYSLDDIYEGAKSTRENYCVSVIGMGAGSQARGEIPSRGKKGSHAAAPPAAVIAPAVKNPTAEVGVGTEDLPFPEPAGAAPTEGAPPGTDAATGKAEQDQPPPPPPAYEEEEGSDSVTLFVGAFGSLLVWILKTFFITFPITVVSFILALFLFFVMMSLISLQLADDNGANGMGAAIDTMFNRPGIV